MIGDTALKACLFDQARDGSGMVSLPSRVWMLAIQRRYQYTAGKQSASLIKNSDMKYCNLVF